MTIDDHGHFSWLWLYDAQKSEYDYEDDYGAPPTNDCDYCHDYSPHCRPDLLSYKISITL